MGLGLLAHNAQGRSSLYALSANSYDDGQVINVEESTVSLLGLIVSALGVAVNLFALLFVLAQIRLLRRQVEDARTTYVDERLRAAKLSTLEFLTSTLDQRLHFMKTIPEVHDKQATREFIERASTDVDVRNSIKAFLNYNEYLATGANAEILDCAVVKRLMGTSLVRTYDTYSEWIMAVREKDQSPRCWEELEKLANRLRSN